MLLDLRTNPNVWIKDSPMHKKVMDYLRKHNLRQDLWKDDDQDPGEKQSSA